MHTAFVTGGSGFVGRNLIGRLHERGVVVRALARSAAAADVVEAAGAWPVRGELLDAAAFGRDLEGCDVVFHCAAVVEEWGPRALYQQINVDGTRAVLGAAHAARVKRFVHVSTEAVYADGGAMADFDESRPLPERPLPRYPASKQLAERAVVAANAPDFATVICRPRLIWGAGDTSVLPKLVEAAKAGRLAWIDRGRYLTQSCHIDNVVEGLLLAAEKGRGGEAYFLTDGEPVEFRDFLSELLATRGVTVPDKSVPYRLAYAFGAICEWLWEHLPLRGAPPVSRMPIVLGGQAVTPIDAKARRELGYTGATTRAAGLAAMRTVPP
ncbi:MAG: NAD-dependent epimerase/dehydratase family protein [Panacagrimonas sp.]